MEIALEKLIQVFKESGLSEEQMVKLITNLTLASDSKNEPKKVLNNYTWGNHDQRPDGDCPTCGCNLSGDRNSPKWFRCPKCNQMLDWK